MLLALIASVSLVQTATAAKIEWIPQDFEFGVSALVPKVEANTATKPPKTEHDPKPSKYRRVTFAAPSARTTLTYKQFDPKATDLDMETEFIDLAVEGVNEDEGEVKEEAYVLQGSYRMYRLTIQRPKDTEITWTAQKDFEIYKFGIRYPKATGPSEEATKFIESVKFAVPKTPPDALEKDWHTTLTGTGVTFQSPFTPLVASRPQQVSGVQVTASAYSNETPATYYLIVDCVIPAAFYSGLDESEVGKLNESLQDDILSHMDAKAKERKEGKMLDRKSLRTGFQYDDRPGVLESCLTEKGNFVAVLYITYPKLVDSPDIKKFLSSIKLAEAK